jgi:hypothetical protein
MNCKWKERDDARRRSIREFQKKRKGGKEGQLDTIALKIGILNTFLSWIGALSGLILPTPIFFRLYYRKGRRTSLKA